MRTAILMVVVGCAPDPDGSGYLLVDEAASDLAVRVDGAGVEARIPRAIAPGAWIETDADRLEIGAGEIAHVQGTTGRIELFVLDVDVEREEVAVTGSRADAEELADALGVELDSVPGGWHLFDSDIWPLLAAVDLPPGDLAIRPVSEQDLPGTVPAVVGEAGAPTGRESWLERVLQARGAGNAGTPLSADRARAEVLFDLPEGTPELPSEMDVNSSLLLVGKYCGEGVDLVLAADGVATRCTPGGCSESPWTATANTLHLGNHAVVVEQREDGFLLTADTQLVDLVLGGCP